VGSCRGSSSRWTTEADPCWPDADVSRQLLRSAYQEARSSGPSPFAEVIGPAGPQTPWRCRSKGGLAAAGVVSQTSVWLIEAARLHPGPNRGAGPHDAVELLLCVSAPTEWF